MEKKYNPKFEIIHLERLINQSNLHFNYNYEYKKVILLNFPFRLLLKYRLNKGYYQDILRHNDILTFQFS